MRGIATFLLQTASFPLTHDGQVQLRSRSRSRSRSPLDSTTDDAWVGCAARLASRAWGAMSTALDTDACTKTENAPHDDFLVSIAQCMLTAQAKQVAHASLTRRITVKGRIMMDAEPRIRLLPSVRGVGKAANRERTSVARYFRYRMPVSLLPSFPSQSP